MKRELFVGVFFFSISTIGFINAQIGINLGTEYGFGVITQTGSEAIKLELGGGISPLLVAWSITSSGFGYTSDEVKIKLYFPGVVGAKLNIKLSGEEKENRLGLKLGMSYNTILKTGYGGGVSYDMIGRKNTIVISGGIMLYPKADDELLARLNEEEGTSFTKNEATAFLLDIQPFVSLSILW